MLPGVVKEVLRVHLVEVKKQHERDLIEGVGRVVLPFVLRGVSMQQLNAFAAAC
jgi:hypothetical protein